MLRIGSKRQPKERINLWGTKFLSLGINEKIIMIRSRVFGIKIQLNLKTK